MISSFIVRSILFAVVCLGFISHAISSDFRFEVALDSAVHHTIMAELSKPVFIKLTNGAQIVGHSVKVQDRQLLVGTSSEGGEARFTFETSELKQIQLPGKAIQAQALQALESQKSKLARGIFERLYYQRVNLLSLLPETESQFFIAYAQAVFSDDDAATALGICQKIDTQIENPASQQQLQRLMLQCYQQLQLHQKSIQLATELTENNRWQPNSGLAYWILANAHYKQGTYDLALRTALEGIVLDTRPYGTYLNSCYALAALSALKLKQLEYAQNLYREMQDSHLEWPQKPSALAKLKKTLIQKFTDHALP